MKMLKIQLQDAYNSIIYVNPNHIVSVKEGRNPSTKEICCYNIRTVTGDKIPVSLSQFEKLKEKYFDQFE